MSSNPYKGAAKEEVEGSHTSSLGGASMEDGDSAGVETGLASLTKFDSFTNARKVDPDSGRVVSNPGSDSASKYGTSFEIC